MKLKDYPYHVYFGPTNGEPVALFCEEALAQTFAEDARKSLSKFVDSTELLVNVTEAK